MPSSSTKPLIGVAGTLVLAGVFTLGLGLGSWATPPVFTASGARGAPAPPVPGLPRSVPTQVRIRSIGVDAPLTAVGLDSGGQVAVPSLKKPKLVGWYRPGPTPGEFGSAVLVGHVDDQRGPAVFHELGRVARGDLIEIARKDKRTAVFRVDSVEKFPKNAFPAERVFREYRGASLRVITCGGAYVGGSLGYADNIIVFASLVDRAAAR